MTQANKGGVKMHLEEVILPGLVLPLVGYEVKWPTTGYFPYPCVGMAADVALVNADPEKLHPWER